MTVSTDIIVGFPGETEDDFQETMEVVEEVGFDSAFTFVYSPRAGTDAAAMPDQIPDELKRERIERLVELVQRVAAERNELRVGRVEEVLVEGPSRTDPSVLRGRTRRNTSVNFTGDEARGRVDRARDLDDARRCAAGRSRRLGGGSRAHSAQAERGGDDRQPEVEDAVREHREHGGCERDPAP